MPRKDAPEFSFDEKTQLYRKKIKNEDGRWIPVYGKSKAEIRTKVKQREKEVARRIVEKDNPLCFQYAASWFALWSPGKGEKNIASIRNAINIHILPVIGNKRMIDVEEADLQLVLNSTADKSKALNTKVLRTMKMIFHAARKDGTISQDPSEDLSPGGTPAKEKNPLTETQQETLLAAIKDAPIYPFVLIALCTGLRREEILALQWDCVFLDCENPYVSVRRAWRWEKNKAIVSDTLKSKASKRDIPIPPQLVELLKDEKEKSKGAYVIGGAAPLTLNVFNRRWDAIEVRSTGTRIARDKNKKAIKDKDGKNVLVQKKLGDKIPNHSIYITIDFPVSPHLLRHTYITRLILAGVNIKVVQYLAGHASVDITLDVYTRLMANHPNDTAAAVMSAF